MAETKVVRIRPYNPKRGCVVQRYMYRGIKFSEGAGWYKVPASLADELEDITQLAEDPTSPPVFDVLTHEEAVALEERERKALERASATNPLRVPASGHKPIKPRQVQSVLTTADLREADVQVTKLGDLTEPAAGGEDAESTWADDMAEEVPPPPPPEAKPKRAGPPRKGRGK